MITIKNKQRKLPIDKQAIKKIVQTLLAAVDYNDFDIGILFVSSKSMRTYNNQYRQKDAATDVLSFPYYPHHKPGKRIKPRNADDQNLGDIIICPEFVFSQYADQYSWDDNSSQEQKMLVNARIAVLIVHGLCHLLGYDHETKAQYQSMRHKELSLLKKLM